MNYAKKALKSGIVLLYIILDTVQPSCILR